MLRRRTRDYPSDRRSWISESESHRDSIGKVGVRFVFAAISTKYGNAFLLRSTVAEFCRENDQMPGRRQQAKRWWPQLPKYVLESSFLAWPAAALAGSFRLRLPNYFWQSDSQRRPRRNSQERGERHALRRIPQVMQIRTPLSASAQIFRDPLGQQNVGLSSPQSMTLCARLIPAPATFAESFTSRTSLIGPL